MTQDDERDIHELILEGHARGVKKVIENSIRTGIPIVIEKDGKIMDVIPTSSDLEYWDSLCNHKP